MEWSDEDHDEVISEVSDLGWLIMKKFSAIYRPSEILAAFAALSDRDFRLLRLTHFAMSQQVEAFLQASVPNFLRLMPSTTHRTIEDRRGAPRGAVDWARTYAVRSQEGSDPSRFISRPIERTMVSPPSRLIAYLLMRLAQIATDLGKRTLPDVVQDRVAWIGQHTSRQLAVLKSRGVSPPASISAVEVGPLRRARRDDITSAVLLFDLLVGTVERANPNLLTNLLRQGILAPGDDDDLFEIWALLKFVGLHLADGWTIEEARLVGGGEAPKRPNFTLQKGGATAEIFYQSAEPQMVKASKYKAMFADYDLPVAVRRPDITVKVSSPTGLRRMIIEVKRTADPGYISDSVYKMLGYVSDFKAALGPDSPLAILLVWSGIAPSKSRRAYEAIQILTAREFRAMPLPY